jgi:hypothetical protein
MLLARITVHISLPLCYVSSSVGVHAFCFAIGWHLHQPALLLRRKQELGFFLAGVQIYLDFY